MSEKKRQQGDGQTSWNGLDRRRGAPDVGYKGDERRRPDPMQHMPGGNPQGGNPGAGGGGGGKMP